MRLHLFAFLLIAVFANCQRGGDLLVVSYTQDQTTGGGGLPFPDPMIRWKFEGNLNDAIGSRNLTGTSPAYTTGPFGDANGAILFSNSASMARITDGFLAENYQNYSFGLWARFDDLVTSGFYDNLFAYDGPNGTGNWVVLSHVPSNTNGIDWRWADFNRSSAGVIAINGVLTQGVWHHIVVNFSLGATNGGVGTSTAEVYLDGVLIGTNSAASPPTSINTNLDFVVGGASDNTRTFQGAIHDLMFWDFALTAQDVSDLYESYPDADATAFISAVETDGTALSTTEEGAIYDLVAGLKSAGIWSKLNAIYPMVNATASAHKYNLKDPRDLDAAYRLTFNGTVTHTSSGIQSDGTTGWANTHLVPSTTLSLTDQALHVSIVGNATQTGTDAHDIGSYNGSAQNMYIQSKTSEADPRYNVRMNAGNTAYTNATAEGHYTLTRGTGNSFAYKNGAEVGNFAHAGTLPNRFVALMNTGFTASGVYSAGYSRQVIGFAAIGGHLTASEVSSFHTLISNYYTAISR